MAGGVVVSLARMDRIREIDLASQRVTVEPGVTNLDVTRAVAADGFYAPDPSSQQVCTIGGNVAENSGGAHCFKHGFTAHHVTGSRSSSRTATSSSFRRQGPRPGRPGSPRPRRGIGGDARNRHRGHPPAVRAPQVVRTLLAGFRTMDAAGAAVSGIVAAGILLSAIEMMDRLTIEAAEPRGLAGLSGGRRRGASRRARRRRGAGRGRYRRDRADLARVGAFELRDRRRRGRPRAPVERTEVGVRRWAGPPRTTTSRTASCREPGSPRCSGVEELSSTHGLRVGNVFHAGDGNLHPLVLYDAEAGETQAARVLAEAILDACLDAGGSLTGEHGVGMDKACSMPRCSPSATCSRSSGSARVRSRGDLQPRQGDPHPRLCGEVPGPYRAHALERIGVAERL